MTEVVLFPYLPLSGRRTIGGWELIPRASLERDDSSHERVVEQAQGVSALYRMPGNDRGMGVFVRPPDGRVGDAVEVTALRTLHDAVVVALLDQNPSRATAGMEDDYNTAHRMATTENALVFGHRFEDDLYTGFETGTMVVIQHIGPKIGETRDVIQPPSDMHLPILATDFDEVYAQALHAVLSDLGEESPDLPGAIRWLELAWTNSASIDTGARVLSLRAGLDVLFGGADTRTIRGRLSALLDDADAPRSLRRWEDHARALSAELTDLEWWFQSFALLRNKIAHGGAIPDDDYIFEGGVPHHWFAEWNLRRAIKKTVAQMGHEEVLLDPFERVFREARPLLEEALREDEQDM